MSTCPSSPGRSLRSWLVRIGLLAALLVAAGPPAWAALTDLIAVDAVHDAVAAHVDQATLKALVAAGKNDEAFDLAFETGNENFEAKFNALDGGGANVGEGQRYTRVPRADLAGAGEWANHTPARATGPNAASCTGCHNTPADDGAGGPEADVHRDPGHTGVLSKMIHRNTPHTMGMGAVQRLAEEMTRRLHQIRAQAAATTAATGRRVTLALVAKGIGFGTITTFKSHGQVRFDSSGVRGVSTDLIVRPFQWKGTVAFIRDFGRGASHNELGMQAVEIVGYGVDGDSDGVVDEMTVGDQTAFAVYLAAQPRPTTRQELAALGLIPALTHAENTRIARDGQKFRNMEYAICHQPELTLDNPIFSEPSQSSTHRDALFPVGLDPVAEGVDPNFPITFDLTKDQPDNQIKDKRGNVVFRLGAFQKDGYGRAIVRLLGDLKRHEMGPALAEKIDEAGTGASNFMTENLWGVGTTAPYMHDGRATTLVEAILLHGGEAEASRNAFLALPTGDQKAVTTYLDNQVLFKQEVE